MMVTTSPGLQVTRQKPYEKLIVWQKANELALNIYTKTKEFPKEEMYGITSQLRKASLSVPTNIVEGTGRQNQKELKYFINIALGSLAETEYLLFFSFNLSYLDKIDYNNLELLRSEVGNLLWRFFKSL